MIDFLGLNDQAKKFGLGSFDLKLYRLVKISGKTENYSISTQQQLDLELPLSATMIKFLPFAILGVS